jgi:hypothetical protein
MERPNRPPAAAVAGPPLPEMNLACRRQAAPGRRRAACPGNPRRGEINWKPSGLMESALRPPGRSRALEIRLAASPKGPQAIAGDGECCAPASSMRNEERHMTGSASSRPFARRRAVSCRQRHRSAQVRKNTNQTTLRISTASPVETVRRASTEGPGSAWRASVAVRRSDAVVWLPWCPSIPECRERLAAPCVQSNASSPIMFRALGGCDVGSRRKKRFAAASSGGPGTDCRSRRGGSSALHGRSRHSIARRHRQGAVDRCAGKTLKGKAN